MPVNHTVAGRIAGHLCVLLLAFVGLLGCDDPTTKQVQKTLQIGVATSGVRQNQLYWIDADRVMFAGYDATDISKNSLATAVQLEVYIWDTKKDSVTRVASLGAAGGLVCYEDGRFRYYTWQVGNDGREHPPPIGTEQDLSGLRYQWDAVPPDPPTPSRGMWLRSQFNCDEVWEADLVRPEQATRDNGVWPLLRRHGYLLSGARFGTKDYARLMSSPVQMWRPGAESGIHLPMMTKELETSSVRYSAYKDVYVVPAGISRQETRATIHGYDPRAKRPVYFISPNGDVQTKWFPAEDWVAAGTGFLPTVAGYLVVSNFSRRAQSADTGAWLVHEARIHKIIDHQVREFSVSPNGCKTAIATTRPVDQQRWTHAITVFDFCS